MKRIKALLPFLIMILLISGCMKGSEKIGFDQKDLQNDPAMWRVISTSSPVKLSELTSEAEKEQALQLITRAATYRAMNAQTDTLEIKR